MCIHIEIDKERERERERERGGFEDINSSMKVLLWYDFKQNPHVHHTCHDILGINW